MLVKNAFTLRLTTAWVVCAWVPRSDCLVYMIALMANGGELNGKRILSQAGTIEAVQNPVVASERPHEVRKTPFWAPVSYNADHFAKTSSGQI
jgi:hypothetical protein